MPTTTPIIQFGAVTFTKADIKAAQLTEAFDPMSITLPVSTLHLTLYSQDADFSIINPAGDYASLEYRQPLAVYETVDGASLFMGQYYLDVWQNVSDTIIQFDCIDLLGILDGDTYDGGIWLTPINAGDLIAAIAAAVDISVDLDPDLYAFQLTGWIPICSYREAFQQIAFAIGATVTATRRSNLKIAKTSSSGVITRGIRCGVAHAGQSRVYAKRWRASQWEGVLPTAVITKADKGAAQLLTKRPQVTGVEVTAHNILSATNTQELYNGVLAIGDYKITFNQPAHDLSITGGTITTSGANYAWVNVTSGGTVVLVGQLYKDTTTVFGVYNTGLPAGTKLNVVKITAATLVNSTNAAVIVQRVYDYYQLRLLQAVKLYAPEAVIGGDTHVDALYNQVITGTVEKMDINLSGGYTAQTSIVGELYTP